ncbi:MAG: hypothetical protein IAE83_18425 [Anaerolinea sp.]|nr:hypothetical protein [Anaerolinea sp.]MCC6976069.1 hypothetical protein [Anaerolineae bacterium]
MRRSITVLFLVSLLLAGCGGETPSPTPAESVLNWDRTPGAVVIRLDRLIGGETDLQRVNRIPACTVYGDGRVVWVNSLPTEGDQVLEAYVNEVGLRAFVEFMIRDLQFYSVPDYAAQELPPSETSPVEVISLVVNQKPYTVRSYRPWKDNLYLQVLERCRKLSDTPALVVPDAGWVTVYEIPRSAELPFKYWSPSAPFSMTQTAASGAAIWAGGPAFKEIWITLRQSLGEIQWVEGEKAFRVALQVPGVSRDAPPAPAITPTPTEAE